MGKGLRETKRREIDGLRGRWVAKHLFAQSRHTQQDDDTTRLLPFCALLCYLLLSSHSCLSIWKLFSRDTSGTRVGKHWAAFRPGTAHAFALGLPPSLSLLPPSFSPRLPWIPRVCRFFFSVQTPLESHRDDGQTHRYILRAAAYKIRRHSGISPLFFFFFPHRWSFPSPPSTDSHPLLPLDCNNSDIMTSYFKRPAEYYRRARWSYPGIV